MISTQLFLLERLCTFGGIENGDRITEDTVCRQDLVG